MAYTKLTCSRSKASISYLVWAYRYVNRVVYAGRLPPVRVAFKSLDGALADVWVVKRGTRSARVRIQIHRRLRWCRKLCIHELFHEIVHVARPRLKHGEQFEREISRIKRIVHVDGDSW